MAGDPTAAAAAAAAAAATEPETLAADKKPILEQFTEVQNTLDDLIQNTTQVKDKLAKAAEAAGGGAKSSRRRKLKGGVLSEADQRELDQLLAKKTELTTTLLKQLTKLNESLKSTAGGAKSRRRGGRKIAGGSAGVAAFSPAVYNIQGLLSDSHDPANVTRDPAFAAMTQLHAPFSAGTVSDTVLSPTNDIAPAAIERITPMVGMRPPIQAGGRAAAAKKKKSSKKA